MALALSPFLLTRIPRYRAQPRSSNARVGNRNTESKVTNSGAVHDGRIRIAPVGAVFRRDRDRGPESAPPGDRSEGIPAGAPPEKATRVRTSSLRCRVADRAHHRARFRFVLRTSMSKGV